MMPTWHCASQMLTKHFPDITTSCQQVTGGGTAYCPLCSGGGTASRTQRRRGSLQMTKTQEERWIKSKKDQIRENTVELSMETEQNIKMTQI